MNTSTLIRPHLTTLWGGGGIVVAGLLSLLATFNAALPLTRDYSLPFASTIPRLASSIILLAAIGILAFGIRGETGIVRRSVVGKYALLIFGLSDVVINLVGLLSHNLGQDALTVEGNFELAFEVIVGVAGVVAAVVIVRADVLHGLARWVLVPVAVYNMITLGLWLIPVLMVTYVATWAQMLQPASLIVLGLSYLLQGQPAVIRNRLHIINENW